MSRQSFFLIYMYTIAQFHPLRWMLGNVSSWSEIAGTLLISLEALIVLIWIYNIISTVKEKQVMSLDVPLRQFLLLKLALAVAVDLNIWLLGPCFNRTVCERILQRYDQQSCEGSHSQVNILMLPAKYFLTFFMNRGVASFPFILAMKSM